MILSNDELIELTKKSVCGDQRATRALVEHALDSKQDSLASLAQAVEEGSLDPRMYAQPTSEDNARFERIMAALPPKRCEP
jgi:hypothetical protein